MEFSFMAGAAHRLEFPVRVSVAAVSYSDAMT